MIQPLNSINANCCGGKRKQSFGDNAQESFEQVAVRAFEPPAKRPSKAKQLALYTAIEFAAGAITSGIIDGGANLCRAVFKNKPLVPFKQITSNAGFLGTSFAVVGLVFTAISASMMRKNN